MEAEIISIGTELLMGDTINTNAAYISQKLNNKGIFTNYHTSVRDKEQDILKILELAHSRSQLIIITGGLGPTDDDMTHDVLAKFMHKTISQNLEQAKILEQKFHNKEMPLINYKQARLIEGARIISNPIGTAIGFEIEYQGNKFITLPGVPREMSIMLENILDKLDSNSIIVSRKIKITNLSESKMTEMILEYFASKAMPNPFLAINPSLAPYAGLGELYLQITAKEKTESQAKILVKELEEQIKLILGDFIYAYDEDRFETLLARILKKKNLSLSFAESCTGGLLSKLMTDLEGASAYTKVNVIAYSNEAKIKILGVNQEIFSREGAVSEICAKEMAIGLSKISDSDINLAITGVAGPEFTENKTIGTIFIAIVIKGKDNLFINSQNQGKVLHEDGYYCKVEKLDWPHRNLTRTEVRELAAKKILWILIKLLKD